MQTAEATTPLTPLAILSVEKNQVLHKDVAESHPRPVRLRLPDERQSITHRFNIGAHKGYVIVGLYPDGQPGELFITMAKEGSTVSGLVSSFAQVVSVALQNGIPLEVFCEKFAHKRFEPSGFTGNRDIPMATSIVDYIFRWLRLRFLDKQPTNPKAPTDKSVVSAPLEDMELSSDAPFCRHCGSQTARNGSCYVCVNCGETTGCG